MSDRCNCVCGCAGSHVPEGVKKHRPIVDRSYLGVYGITSPWAGWLISRAPELVAEPAGFLQRVEVAPACPDYYCSQTMVRRPGAWKCYHHDPPRVIRVPIHLPGTPEARVLSLQTKGVRA